MFDILVDCEIEGMREQAKQGNPDSMIALVTHMMIGEKTPQSIEKSEKIVRHLLEQKEQLEPNQYWDALCLMSEIHWMREEDETVNEIALILIRDMVQKPFHQWNFSQLFNGIERMQNVLMAESEDGSI